MAGTVQTTQYDASQVGTPWQELVKAVPTLTGGFSTVYQTVAQPTPVSDVTTQPLPPAQPSGGGGLQLNGQTLLYAGVGLGALVGLVVLFKAIG